MPGPSVGRLPTTAPIRWFVAFEWAARNEPYLGYLLLSLASLGALTTWPSVSRGKKSIGYELKLRKFLRWCGIPIVACSFILCTSAMWAGMIRPGDLHSSNIGGLIPYNDAHGHIVAAFDQARDGTWTAFAQRRPFAAAFRSVLLVMSGYSFIAMLLFQACLLAIAACLASYAVIIWRGVWAGLAFFGMTYIYARIFAPTTLTEPFGLFWSLLSVPFFIEAFRTGSVKPAIAGFAMTLVALLTRMGSMFTVPALALWLVWQFGHGVGVEVRNAVLATGVLLCVFGLNSLLSNAYGTSGGEIGSNFSYVLCGLSIGTTWQGCPAKLAAIGEPLKGDEATDARRLYKFAWQNFLAEPEVFLRRLMAGVVAFAEQFPEVMWKGYGVAVHKPTWLFPKALTAIFLIGLAYVGARVYGKVEIAFWALVWTSILASSAIIYSDDGSRALAASHPLIALFLATGMTNSTVVGITRPESARLLRYGTLGLVIAAAFFICGPWIAHRFPPIGQKLEYIPKSNPDEAFVFGGRQMSGFLVLGNSQPLRADIPTIHLKDFEEMVALSGIYESLLRPVTPEPPFGFIFAPRLERGIVSPSQFVVPANVMEHRESLAWHFKLRLLQPNSEEWFYAEKVEPWLP